MDISQVSRADLDSLRNIAQVSILRSVRVKEIHRGEIVAATFDHIESSIQRSDCVFLKGVRISGSVGFILIKKYWNLSDLYVLPSQQGNGFGRELLEFEISEAIKHNDRGYIRVNSSINAEGFYRKLGFETYPRKQGDENFIIPLIYKF